MNVTKGQIFKYTFLPGLIPRTREFLTFGLSHLAYFVAMIFQAVRILPRNHPYLRSENYGQFTISQVLAQTFKHLTFNFKHIDQIFIFFTIVLGIALFFVQLAILLVSAFIPLAKAAVPGNLDDILLTSNPEDDIAFMLLDRVFGIQGFFGSRVDADLPLPYHEGLHVLYQTYSTAMIVVALVILTYFVITIIGETIKDGTAFGKRMNRVWAPIRLLVAFGLLIPIASGLNSGQYIVLVAAKWGSGLATNALEYFYGEIGSDETPFGDAENLIARPNIQDPTQLAQFMFVARACQYGEMFGKQWEIPPGRPRSAPDGINGYLLTLGPAGIESELVFDGKDSPTLGPGSPSYSELGDFKTMVEETGYESLIFVFGEKDTNLYSDFPGSVKPFCGRLTFPVIAPENEMIMEAQHGVFEALLRIWHNLQLVNTAGTVARNADGASLRDCSTSWYPSCAVSEFDPSLKSTLVSSLRLTLKGSMDLAIANNLSDVIWCGPEPDSGVGFGGDYNDFGEFGYSPLPGAPTPGPAPSITDNYLNYGWAGAAICYNKIAQVNGDVTAASVNIPSVDTMPMIMEAILRARMAASADISPENRYEPTLPNGQDVLENSASERSTYHTSNAAYEAWIGAEAGSGAGPGGAPGTSGNIIRDTINFIFGTGGLFNMLSPENREVHPLAQLASAGRSLVEASIRNIGASGGAMALAAIPGMGMMSQIGGSFMLTFATISLAAGFVLFYMVPFLPFLYFFFAVGGWIKGIFEAMVGVPLWALAHLRIDGDGFAGQAALNGYFLIFEIFLRPLLILFGLLASTLIFAALVRVLNEMWTLVVSNVAGYDALDAADAGFPITSVQFWRAPIDEFFYTITYTIVVYMVGLSCFKLIDLVPNNILRWIGHSVEAFGEQTGDPTARLSQTATIGFSATSDKLTSAVQQGGGAASAYSGYQSRLNASNSSSSPGG